MNEITIKGIVEEDFTQYKECSMVVMFPNCSFKCELEAGCKMCQNSELVNSKNIKVSTQRIIDRFMNNPISKALVLSGLEPFDSYADMINLIQDFRKQCANRIVIYSGYTKDELSDRIPILHDLGDVVIKYGRYIPNQCRHFDECLGVHLASDNQYAENV